jgi:hypothetical protein
VIFVGEAKKCKVSPAARTLEGCEFPAEGARFIHKQYHSSKRHDLWITVTMLSHTTHRTVTKRMTAVLQYDLFDRHEILQCGCVRSIIMSCDASGSGRQRDNRHCVGTVILVFTSVLKE